MDGLINALNNFGIPKELLAAGIFYLVAGICVLAASFVVLSKNIFHAALSLGVMLIGVAAIYLYLDAEFIAVMQVLIYVGAILTLIIFAIMLTAKISDKAIKGANENVLVAALACDTLLFILAKLALSIGKTAPAAKTEAISLAQLGQALIITYGFPFEVLSVVLLAALVGAIALAYERK